MEYAEKILNERNVTHGNYVINSAMAQALKQEVRRGMNWKHLSASQAESLDIICTKIGRILSGDPDAKDHWDDIAGYAKLISERLS